MIMKTNKILLFLASCLTAAAICGCAETEAEPVSYEAPVVNFTMPSDEISVAVGDSVHFTAEVVSGDKVSVAWYINDRLASGSASFNYAFDIPGTYTVRFEARNGAGTVDHSYTVSVSDKLEIVLSVGDSTRVTRLQKDYLQVAAIVEHGQNVTHEWTVDGAVAGTDAYFATLQLLETRDYVIGYKGTGAGSSIVKSFTVGVIERPLEIVFTITDEIIALLAGRVLNISANITAGGSGIQHKWTLDGEVVSTEATFSKVFENPGEFVLKYEGVNAKNEKVERTWKINVTASGRLFDDFEYEVLGPWWTLKQNDPGIELVDNPLKDGVNSSDKCLSDRVFGSGGTSGYFDLKTDVMLSEAEFNVANYSGIRFLLYTGASKYYPRIDYAGTKYPSVTPPKFNGGWEKVEYQLPEGTFFDPTKKITFRALLNEDGTNTSGGAFDNPELSRTVYIDDIEFFK